MNKKKIIITVITIILLNAIALGAWFYLFYTIEKQNNFVKEGQKKLLISEKNFENNKSLNNLINEISNEREKINSAFVDKDSIINFVERLEALGSETGASVKIESINTDIKDKKGLYIRFSLKGDFNQLFKYLNLTEDLPYLINVEKINLRNSTSDEWTATFEILVKSFIKT